MGATYRKFHWRAEGEGVGATVTQPFQVSASPSGARTPFPGVERSPNEAM